MNLYEKRIDTEMRRWYSDIVKSAGLIERAAEGVQKKTQQIVPRKVQDAVTGAVEGMTRTIMNGSGLLTIRDDTSGMSLAERDYLVLHSFHKYQKTATAQGVGFGLGGIFLGMADLPVLMSIKIKFLFDTAKLYGYDTELSDERLFILYVFQLAFSGKEHRLDVFRKLEDWDTAKHDIVDWEKFQIEYRDYLDVAKMLQLLPIVGSVAGGTANYKLMHRLCENAMNCYRMRIIGRSFTEADIVRPLSKKK